MTRAPYQVCVFPFRREPQLEFALFFRQDGEYWQGIAGGGEGREIPIQAAMREALEEAGIPDSQPFFPLSATASIPVNNFRESADWPNDLFVIPAHCFGVDVGDHEIAISHEHIEQRWFTYESAIGAVKWDLDRSAIWELRQRIESGHLAGNS